MRSYSSLKQLVVPYLAYIRSSMLGMLAYRLRYFTGILTYLLYVSIHYFIWEAVFKGSAAIGSEELVINGYRFSEMITYIAVAWVARSLYFSNIDYEIDDIVKTGQIGIYLLRPVNFQLLLTAQALGECVFRAAFFTLPIAVVILCIFPVSLPAGWGAALGFLLATVGGFFILAQINFLVGIVAVYFKSISNVMQAKHYLIQLLSGLLLPLSFFPDWAQGILKALPFQAITYAPMQVYLGKFSGVEVGALFLQQALWIAVLFCLGQYFWSKAAARLVLQGG